MQLLADLQPAETGAGVGCSAAAFLGGGWGACVLFRCAFPRFLWTALSERCPWALTGTSLCARAHAGPLQNLFTTLNVNIEFGGNITSYRRTLNVAGLNKNATLNMDFFNTAGADVVVKQGELLLRIPCVE